MPMTLIISVFNIFIFLILPVLCQHPTPPSSPCPPKFNIIGKKCYHFSKEQVRWQDAHFKCLELNSTFAVVSSSHQELLIRRFINKNKDVLGKYERWIAGRFNWKQSRWEWGTSGKPLTFHAFSRMNANLRNKWKWHCIIIDPSRYNKWGARSCWSKKRYVCQTPIDKYALKHQPDYKMCNDYSKLTPDERRKCDQMAVPGFLVKPTKKKPTKYIYNNIICPSHMILVGRKCYYFSTDRLNWDAANWACRDNHTKLAMVHNKLQDDILRGFLKNKFVAPHERWIGGFYDWGQSQWKWAINGQVLKFTNFAQTVNQKEYICTSLDPKLDFRWKSDNCLEPKHYICQGKSKTVAKYDEKRKLAPDATVVIKVENETDNQLNPLYPLYNQPTQPTNFKYY